MTQDWDDILSEPIGLLQPDLPAVEGGWRAVSPLDKVSPRPQQALQTLPEPDGMLSFPAPEQPAEEPAGPAWLDAPSLTEQLSLTWASRRQRRRRATPDAPDVSWPAWEPAAASATELPRAVPAWQQPLRRLITLFRRREAAQPAPVAEPRAVLMDEPAPAAPPETPRTTRQQQPLTFARARREDPAPLRSTAPSILAAVADSPTTAEAPTPSPVLLQATPPPPRREAARQQPPGAPDLKPPVETPHLEVPDVSDKPAEPGFSEVPLVDRVQRPEADAPPLPTQSSPTESPRAPAASTAPAKQETADDGEPLSPVLRERMETLLDVPLREVRVFRNSIARQVTREHAAEAVTVANDVYVAPGRGEPSTPAGQALLAHELSHVAARQAGSEPSHAEEKHAQALEHAVASPAAPAARPRAVPMAPGPALDHRLSPVRGAMRPQASAQVNDSAAGGRSGGMGGPGPGAATSHVLATAPLDRIPATAISEPALAPMEDGAAPPVPETSSESTDETGLVERVVDAVLRRMRRESALERERRGAFRSEIGG